MERKKTFSHNQTVIFWLIAIVVLTLYNLTPALNSFDTEYYILAGQNFLDGKIDCLRTPVYPLLCQTLIKLFGIENLPTAMTIFQSLVYLISLVSLQHIANYTIKNKTIRFITLTFYILCIAPGWCNEILTESLCISGCVIMTDLVLSFIYKPTIAKNIALHLFLILLVFLRPTFIIFFAILPVVWLFHRTLFKHIIISFSLTIICIACFGAYCYAYMNVYGKFGTSSALVINKIYDAHRGGYWDASAVNSAESKKWIDYIDEHYTGNYGFLYQFFSEHPESIVPISKGCDEIIQSHKSEWQKYRIQLFASSCDKRMQAAVNTHTPLSSALFFSSLLLSFPLSMFYLIIILAAIALLVNIAIQKVIPLGHFLIIAVIFAHTVGIVLNACDSNERLLLPVYPLFIVMLGSAFEKATQFFRLN